MSDLIQMQHGELFPLLPYRHIHSVERLSDTPNEWGREANFFEGVMDWCQRQLPNHRLVVGSYWGSDGRVHPFELYRTVDGQARAIIHLPKSQTIEYRPSEAFLKDKHDTVITHFIPQVAESGRVVWEADWTRQRVNTGKLTFRPGATNYVILEQCMALVKPLEERVNADRPPIQRVSWHSSVTENDGHEIFFAEGQEHWPSSEYMQRLFEYLKTSTFVNPHLKVQSLYDRMPTKPEVSDFDQLRFVARRSREILNRAKAEGPYRIVLDYGNDIEERYYAGFVGDRADVNSHDLMWDLEPKAAVEFDDLDKANERMWEVAANIDSSPAKPWGDEPGVHPYVRLIDRNDLFLNSAMLDR